LICSRNSTTRQWNYWNNYK